MNERITEVATWLKEYHHSFAFVTSTANIFYLSNFYINPHERLVALIIFPNEEPILVCPHMEMANAKQAGWLFSMIGYDDTEDPWSLIKKKVKVIHSIAIESSHLSFGRSEQLKQLFPNTSLSDLEAKLTSMRLVKSDKEIAMLREAAALADYGVEIGIDAIAKGKTEVEIVALIEYELKKKGIREMSFATMVLTGEKTASPHGVPGLTEIKSGDFVLFDLGVVLDGYCSDITRTVVCDKATRAQQDIYQSVLAGQLAALQVCQPGTEISKIDLAARESINSAGFGDYFTHRIGHGLGIDVHEFPSLTNENSNLLQTGMVFTIEPGIYVPGVGGVRIEDDVLITENGVERLTNFTKELLIV